MGLLDQDFETFSEKCISDFANIQKAFLELYDIESYESWFYNHDIGAFHFYTGDEKNLYFKHVDVGSFSTKSDTWMWGWNNKSIPPHITRFLKKVKTFGQENQYLQLTEGLFNADKNTGIAMTAISAKLLNAIGGYTIPCEQLLSYFIFTNELSQEEFAELKEKIDVVSCERHGSGRAAFVCQHLNKDVYTGFHEAFDPDTIRDDEEYQAWCGECENVRLLEDGWTEKSMAFAKIKLVCDGCFFEIREKNSAVE